jgi:hypothetical protein
MSFWDRHDMTTHPLTDRHVALMAKIGIGVFRNHETGECYVSRRSWETCGQLMQEAVRRLVLGPPTDDEGAAKLQAALAADASEASHE